MYIFFFFFIFLEYFPVVVFLICLHLRDSFVFTFSYKKCFRIIRFGFSCIHICIYMNISGKHIVRIRTCRFGFEHLCEHAHDRVASASAPHCGAVLRNISKHVRVRKTCSCSKGMLVFVQPFLCMILF